MMSWFKNALRWFRDESGDRTNPGSNGGGTGSVTPPNGVRAGRANALPGGAGARAAGGSPAPAIPAKSAAAAPAGSPAGLGSAQPRVGAGPGTGTAGAGDPGERIFLPLQPILEALPSELKTRVRGSVPGDLEISLPVAPIVAQLAQGQVRITFGELRQAAPGTLVGGPEVDSTPVSLPLELILPRVGVDRLPRRRDQKVVTVPEDVVGPFGPGGRILAEPAGADRAAPVRKDGAGGNGRAGVHAVAPAHRGGDSVPGAIRSHETAFYRSPAAPVVRSGPIPAPAAGGSDSTTFFARAAGVPPTTMVSPATPVSAPPAGAGPNGQGYKRGPAVASGAAGVSSPPMPPHAAPSPTPAGETLPGTVLLPLADVSAGWPDAVVEELARLNVQDARLVIPASILEKGLRQGRVEFPWRLIRAWIRPAVATYASPHDAVPLSLPLAVVAPAFLQQRKPVSHARRELTADESIPNLFGGKGTPVVPQGPAGGAAPAPHPAPLPAAASGHAAAPADTNFYSALDLSDTAATHASGASARGSSSGGTTEWVRRSATPREVVERAVGLPGVAGALVALPDGLGVASQVPPQYNSETLAAFLPQIYAKVSQCTQELRMGGLNNLSFTVGTVPWKIFRVNNIFFAAFGRAGEPMPTAQLAALAAELDRKPRTA
ncbi:MAG: hypothetical protein KatS3mg132_431 [Limisphaera sp.]|nr:MAG: hypothetical protein KatS3mg132_431 [Limisphaera sp.]